MLPRLRRIRTWLGGHKQRLAYPLVAVSLTVALVSGIAGGFMLHRSADLERQTLRTQQLDGAAFRIEDFTLEAQGAKVPTGLVRLRAQAIVAANAAFDLVESHDHGEGSRLRPGYLAYLAGSERAFGLAITHAGRIPPAEERLVESQLATFAALINVEVNRLASDTRETNPQARLALVVAVAAVVVLLAALVWQFSIERRADRENARRSAELVRLRDEFVAAVSHELRTPLTSIIGYLELVRDAKPGEPLPDQETLLAIVERNAGRLLKLVNDLLFVAEVEGGMLSLDLRDVDVGALATECVTAAMPAASAKAIELTYRDGSVEAHIQGDPVRLAQMMDNLVSNAIKFTPRGGRVQVAAAAGESDVVFEVSDSGAGISAIDQAQLYERFFRAHSAAADAAPGTGLGLTITKAIVDAHRGSIDVESDVGAGTTFRVRLPRRQPSSSTAAS